MIRIQARAAHPDLARLQAPATPDGVFVRGKDGTAAKAVGGRPTLEVKRPIGGNSEDLNPPQLKELELTLERPAPDPPATQVPAGQGVGQFVEVLGPERVHNHAPPPGAMFHHRRIAVFRLDCTPVRGSVEKVEEKNPPQNPPCRR
jgi:hypothetical protein